MIRAAKLEDSPRIAELMVQAFARSRYKDVAGAGTDRTYALQFIKGVLMLNGRKSAEATWCNVWVENGRLLGYHFGMEQRIQQVGTLYEAVNLHFYVDPQASPFAGISLLKSFFTWAAGRARIYQICMDANDLMGDQHYEWMKEAYTTLGFQPCATTLRRVMIRAKAAKEAA